MDTTHPQFSHTSWPRCTRRVPYPGAEDGDLFERELVAPAEGTGETTALRAHGLVHRFYRGMNTEVHIVPLSPSPTGPDELLSTSVERIMPPADGEKTRPDA